MWMNLANEIRRNVAAVRQILINADDVDRNVVKYFANDQNSYENFEYGEVQKCPNVVVLKKLHHSE